MGQKADPRGLRLKINQTWQSRWFAKKDFAGLIEEDDRLRKVIRKKFSRAGVAKIEISRSANQVKITIFSSRPGIIIGRAGAGIEDLRKELLKITKSNLQLSIEEVKQPNLEATLVGQMIAEQIEKRVAYRRAVKKALEQVMKAGAKGVRIYVGGRLNGAEISRSETFVEGKVPLSTLRADIDYAKVGAQTTYGVIGIKVWIYKGERSKTLEEESSQI